MGKKYKVSFPESGYDSFEASEGQSLSEELTASNSPVLFGCRTGICGTCLCEVAGELSPPDEDEQEILEVHAPENPKARLACQIDLTNDISLKPIA